MAKARNEIFLNRLAQELKRLQKLLNHGHELKLKWVPRKIQQNGQRLCGEVVGETIYIYEEDENEALRTLRHEIIEHLLFTFEKNYVELINNLIEVFNEIQREKREELVEKIVNAFSL